jgi:hypothetical protein
MKPMGALVPGIPRKIVGYHRDEYYGWVADLECGHRQHVRYNPPWTTRHWVTTPEGRSEHIGHEFLCLVCSSAASIAVIRPDELRYATHQLIMEERRAKSSLFNAGGKGRVEKAALPGFFFTFQALSFNRGIGSSIRSSRLGDRSANAGKTIT